MCASAAPTAADALAAGHRPLEARRVPGDRRTRARGLHFRLGTPDGSLEHELLTTVTFEAHGSKTRLTLRQGVFETTGRRDDHVTGWSSTLERLAEYLTTQGG